ncbi:hypothetical protein [Candidatus Paracaedibacter symbiosus]|uniref:hypothetical protein n=1 Tax=Candidatus Paracaedibacter symbiosus TaxID=244582 RepID=UPI000509D4B7|nr:hypothetical protein [Candidatus Paracaedibacter symbiosus]
MGWRQYKLQQQILKSRKIDGEYRSSHIAKIRLTSWFIKADKLIGISQGRISIRTKGKNTSPTGRIHDCSRSFLLSTNSPLKKH